MNFRVPNRVGKAAFYKTVEEARTLAHQIISVSKGLDLPTTVALTRALKVVFIVTKKEKRGTSELRREER
ncbi:unnamed protein product [Timema podura]|uniref:Ribosomal protein S5 n=1 Tax=Timema podura TaxID=61482 RepID=A0ABN7NWL7_TIMPD|nr:unnamed protein product [Timema podura]